MTVAVPSGSPATPAPPDQLSRLTRACFEHALTSRAPSCATAAVGPLCARCPAGRGAPEGEIWHSAQVTDLANQIKRLAAGAGRGHSVLRRLPDDLGGCRFPASLEGGAKFLKWDLHTVDPTLTQFARRYVTPGARVWDIGANVGLFTFMASGMAGPTGSVLAVEADTWLAGNLRRAALANSGGAPVSVLPAALGRQNGVAEFAIGRNSRATNYLVEAGGSCVAGGIRERQFVPTLTLDGLLETFPPPSVLKIDVEGAELDVLSQASNVLAARPVVLVEVFEQIRDAVHSVLEPHGYRYLDATSYQPVDLPRFNTVAFAPAT